MGAVLAPGLGAPTEATSLHLMFAVLAVILVAARLLAFRLREPVRLEAADDNNGAAEPLSRPAAPD